MKSKIIMFFKKGPKPYKWGQNNFKIVLRLKDGFYYVTKGEMIHCTYPKFSYNIL